MKKLHQQELLEWAEAAIDELSRLEADRRISILIDGGRALIKEAKLYKEE
jgi:hypothetical protein